MAFYDRGLGISRNILECYRFLFDHFQAGDCVFLFGWHGASTRSGTSGAAPAAPPPSWPASSTCGRRSRSSARSHAFRHRFHNTRLSDSVEFGCHALAIDDERLTFHPTLWDEPDPRVEQVWFPGMHSDPGGGYAEAHLSDIALQWIARHAMARGLLLYERHLVTGDPRADGVMHDSRNGIQRLYRRRVRSWRCSATPTVHPSVGERSRAVAAYRPWILQREYEVARESSEHRVFRG